MASTTKFALSVCKIGNETCRGVLNDIAGLLSEHNGLPKTAKEDEEFAIEKCDLITYSLEDAKSASSDVDRACTEAEKQAALGKKDMAVKEMDAADAASKIAAGIAIGVQSLFAEARQVKFDIMRQIMENDFEVRDQRLKRLVGEEEKEYLRITGDMESEIEKLERDIAKQANKEEEEKTRLKAEALRARLVLQQRKHAELARTMATWTEEVTDANDFANLMDAYNYALTTANDVDEWLEEYRKLLQHVVPKFLYDWYNTTSAGCLDPLFEDDFTATVELAEVASNEETLSEKCESPDFTSGP
jgi:hypothetical protein